MFGIAMVQQRIPSTIIIKSCEKMAHHVKGLKFSENNIYIFSLPDRVGFWASFSDWVHPHWRRTCMHVQGARIFTVVPLF